MSAFQRLRKTKFFIKLRSWEYWPFGIVQAPLFFYFPWLSLRARSLFFFSASNPGILMGGMFGESKFDVLQLVPALVKPRTLLQSVPTTVDDVLERMQKEGMNFPVIFKPDLGERGWMVKKIDSQLEIPAYLEEIKIDFLIQDFVNLPLEFGVFYSRYPTAAAGRVTSVVEKEMLHVIGDGRSTLGQLIWENERAVLQWEILRITFEADLDQIIPKGEKRELVSIGNHCLGTKFINGNQRITEKLSASFDAISKQVSGFYFGRYDLRAASYEDLEKGNVQIVELNGCGAEPAHIYQPGFPIWAAMGVLIRHWRDIFRISRENHARGTAYLSYAEGVDIYRKFRALRK